MNSNNPLSPNYPLAIVPARPRYGLPRLVDFERVNRDSDAPSPLVGEGWGEGGAEHFTLLLKQLAIRLACKQPQSSRWLSLALSHQGRGDRLRTSQRGVTLVELIIALAISAIILASLNSLVKLGLDAQAHGRSANELAYQGRFALERITDQARATPPRELTTPAANTTGDWFAPVGCVSPNCVRYCLNTNQLFEISATTAALALSTACVASTNVFVIANNVSTFTATLPASTGAVDRHSMVISITLSDANNTLPPLTSNIRLGGGVL